MASSNLAHHFHCKLVVVTGHVGCRENWSKLVLSWCNFVMFSFCKDSKLPELAVEVLHELLNARFNHTKIVIFKFLTFWSLSTKKCATCVDEVFTLVINALINKEVFLLWTYSCFYRSNSFVSFKKFKHTNSLLADCLHRTKKRSLFIEGLAGVRTESSWNTKSSVLNKCIAGRVPGSVTAGFKGRTNSSTWKAGSIRLTLNKLLAAELHDNFSVICWCDKAVVFFSSNSGKRLEPVSKVCSPLLYSPVFHCVCNNSGNRRIQLFAAFNSLHQLLICFFWQPCFHYSFIKNVFSKNWCYFVHSYNLLYIKKNAALSFCVGQNENAASLPIVSFSEHANGSRNV